MPVGATPDVTAPEAATPGEETWQRVRDLPPRQRAVLLLRYAGDLPHRDVAAALGCSEEASRQAAREGLNRLRNEIGER